jgi:ATP-binding cassette subfamily B protein
MMREQPLRLIRDEPTSALDAHAEHELFERYAESARMVARATGGIAVFVSHRFSTVRMADRIVVVADGRIAEQGTHEELVALGGVYAELYALQASAYAA